MVAHAFTVDVEDWFHILDCPQSPKPCDYSSYESRVIPNTQRVLNILDELSIKGTFFVLGWVAEQFPDLVGKIAEKGHEIGVHGYAHVLASELSDTALEDDTYRAIEAVTKAAGVGPQGYRSPGGSLLERQRWIFELLANLGIKYDSSVYPRPGGLAEAEGYPSAPYIIYQSGDSCLWEYPSSIETRLGLQWAFAEGGYLRLLPMPVVAHWFRQWTRNEAPVNCCVHPREFDPDHPRLRLSAAKQWKMRVGLNGFESKVISLLKRFDFKPMGSVLDDIQRR